MFNNRSWGMTADAASLAALVAVCIGLASVRTDDDDDKKKEEPTPIGAWFGIARPCTFADGTLNPLADQDFCRAICGGSTCKRMSPAFPHREVTMIPTLLFDGTVMADDFAEVGLVTEGPGQHGD